MDGLLLLGSEGASFFDETFLYISGALLVALALGTAFLGMRSESFPDERQLKLLGGVAAVLVVCTSIGAVQSARFEQAERREKNAEAAEEAAAEEQATEEEEAPLGEGEAAEPGTEDGAEPDGPQGDVPPDASGNSAGEGPEGRTLFVDSGCGDCHALVDAGTQGSIGPVLDDVLPEQSAEMIRTSIVDPDAEISEGFPEGVMPSTYGEQFTEAELGRLSAYLAQVTGE